jgi:hypothetical protein
MQEIWEWLSSAARVAWRKPHAKVAIITAAALVGLTGAAGATAVVTHNASQQFADATFGKLGGNSDEVLQKIADRVVKRLTSNQGALAGAKDDIVASISKAASKKLGAVDADTLISNASGDLVAAGMDKLSSIDVKDIVDQVTHALIAQASAEVAKLDLNKLAQSAINGLIAKVDIEKLIKQKLDSIDVEKLVSDAVAKQVGGSTGGLLGSLIFRR